MSDYYAMWGMPNPNDGEKGQEVTDPASVGGSDGENGQGLADPVDTEPMEEPEKDEQQAGEGSEDGKPEQNAEERRRQAAKRRADAEEKRRKEQEEQTAKAIQTALEQERKTQAEKLKEIFAAQGLKNPKTDKPVESIEEYERMQQEFQAEKLARELKAGRLTPEGLQQALSTMPQIRELVEGAKTAKENADHTAFNVQKEMELAEIRKLNPHISTIDDILKMPTGKQFAAYVQRGNSFQDAYFLANRDAILQQQRAAARQSARNETAGKGHMQASGQQLKGSVTVTDRDRAAFRRFSPEITDEEIARYLNRN